MSWSFDDPPLKFWASLGAIWSLLLAWTRREFIFILLRMFIAKFIKYEAGGLVANKGAGMNGQKIVGGQFDGQNGGYEIDLNADGSVALQGSYSRELAPGIKAKTVDEIDIDPVMLLNGLGDKYQSPALKSVATLVGELLKIAVPAIAAAQAQKPA